MTEQKLKFRKKSRIREREEVQDALDRHINPLPEVASLPAIPVLRGVKPAVVRDWSDDTRKVKLREYLLQGLSPKEAGILAGYAPEQVDDLTKRSDEYRRFVQNALIEFKQKHLKVISDKSDPKLSQWLLEKMFPEEFASKVGRNEDGGAGSSTTVIQAIVKTVQGMNDNPVTANYRYANSNSSEKKQDDGGSQDDRPAEPSLDSGGANIIR